MFLPRTLLFFFILFVNVLCSQPTPNCIPGRFSETVIFSDAQIHKDTNIVVAYSFNPFSNSIDSITMNIYYPDTALDPMTERPFILLAHGGSFLTGDLSTQEYLCAEYAKRGFVSASINYRLGWNCPYFYLHDFCFYCPSDTGFLRVATYMAVQDIRTTLRFMGNNPQTWSVDPNWFFVGGASAGSIASLHAAIWTQSQANQFAPLAMSMVGLLDTAGNTFPVNYTIRGITDNCGAIAEDSNLVSQLTIPMISFNDEFDCFVPSDTGHIFMCACNTFYKVYGSGFIHPRMQAAGNCTELNTAYNSNNHCSWPAPIIVQRSACFFKRIMCNTCVSDTNSNLNYVKPCDSLGTGIEFWVDNFSVSVFPVPANDLVTVNFSEHAKHSGSFKCLNCLGQVVFSQSYAYMTKKIEIGTSSLPPGTYFIIFENAEQSRPLKMLIVH